MPEAARGAPPAAEAEGGFFETRRVVGKRGGGGGGATPMSRQSSGGSAGIGVRPECMHALAHPPVGDFGFTNEADDEAGIGKRARIDTRGSVAGLAPNVVDEDVVPDQ